LLPLFEQGRVWLPPQLWYDNYEDKRVDLVKAFIDEEYAPFPRSAHDDMLDCLARIVDPEFPVTWPLEETEEDPYSRSRRRAQRQYASWMTL
jgi:hypothetical protein